MKYDLECYINLQVKIPPGAVENPEKFLKQLVFSIVSGRDKSLTLDDFNVEDLPSRRMSHAHFVRFDYSVKHLEGSNDRWDRTLIGAEAPTTVRRATLALCGKMIQSSICLSEQGIVFGVDTLLFGNNG